MGGRDGMSVRLRRRNRVKFAKAGATLLEYSTPSRQNTIPRTLGVAPEGLPEPLLAAARDDRLVLKLVLDQLQ